MVLAGGQTNRPGARRWGGVGSKARKAEWHRSLSSVPASWTGATAGCHPPSTPHTLLSTLKIPACNQAPHVTRQAPAGMKLVVGGGDVPGNTRPHRHELLPPPLPAAPLSCCPAVVFCLRSGSFPLMCCGLGPGQLEMESMKLLGSKGGAVWAGRALSPAPGHSLNRPPPSRGPKPSRGLPGPAPLCPPGAPSSQLQKLPFTRWPTAGLAERLPEVAGEAAGWVPWAEVAPSERSRGLASGEEGQAGPGHRAPKVVVLLPLPPRSVSSLPTSVGWCFHNRKIKSICHSVDVSALRAGLR